MAMEGKAGSKAGRKTGKKADSGEFGCTGFLPEPNPLRSSKRMRVRI